VPSKCMIVEGRAIRTHICSTRSEAPSKAVVDLSYRSYRTLKHKKTGHVDDLDW
jgi:hypothetical protein